MKLLYLCKKYYWDCKMSRGARFHYPTAVSRQPGVELRCSGDGFDSWDNSLTLEQNVARWDWRPDWVWCYKPEDHRGVAEYGGRKLVTYNEAWWPEQKAKREVEAMGADLVVCHHENDVPRFLGFQGRVEHIPHAAERSIFWPRREQPTEEEWLSRSISCLSSGVQSPEIYPLRARLAGLVRSGKVKGFIRQHPGYRMLDQKTCDLQFSNYAAELRQSRIALCCTSRYRYTLAKLIEAAMAGCCVATDLPEDSWFLRHFGGSVIKLDAGMSDHNIASMLNWHLGPAGQSTTYGLAMAAQRTALRLATTDHYAQRLLSLL